MSDRIDRLVGRLLSEEDFDRIDWGEEAKGEVIEVIFYDDIGSWDGGDVIATLEWVLTAERIHKNVRIADAGDMIVIYVADTEITSRDLSRLVDRYWREQGLDTDED